FVPVEQSQSSAEIRILAHSASKGTDERPYYSVGWHEISIDKNLYDIDLRLNVQASDPRSTLSNSNLYTRAITSLLESADTDFWEKSDNEIDPVDFYGEILEVLVKHYARSIPEISVGMKSYDVLEGLPRDVKDAGYLQGDVSQFDAENSNDE